MEILLFIFPLLSFLLFKFIKQKINTVLLYALNIFLYCISLTLSLYVFFKILNIDKDLPLYFYTLIKFDKLFLEWSLRFDLLVSSLIVLVMFIGLLLTMFSMKFLKNDEINFKINSSISLSIFSILVLITSNNLIQFFLAWYLIILSTYLISEFFESKADNSNIFFQNRVSDLFFFLSLYFIYKFSNSISFDIIFKSFQILENKISVLDKEFRIFDIVTFILFFSFLLRCRKFYISNSRYDIMTFDTSSYSLTLFVLYLPVGLYFVLRFLTLTQISFDYLNFLLILGSILTFIFSILLIFSYNLKKLMLYFVSAQFGVILILVGLQLYNAAIFHFFTSTLSLVILSLAFGIISSKLNYEQDIRKMGYLVIKCPSLFVFILIGFVSLLGIPYFSGFYSNKLIFFQLSLINKESYFLVLTYCFFYTFIISYISFKIMLIVFLGNNNCNIHLYNKLEDSSNYLKCVLFILSIFIIFSGWCLNNLFSGNFSEYLWRLVLVGEIGLSINHNLDNNQWLFETRYLVCYFGIFMAFFNYIIIPKFGNNIKLKKNKLFKKYLKSFTSYSFNR